MKKSLKRLLSVLLAVTVVIGSAPLSGLVGLELPDWVALDASAQISEDLADNDLVADYTELNKLREEAAAIDRTAYTDDSLDALDAVLEKITDDKKISEQDIVDGWADELEAALAGLERDASKAAIKITTILDKKEVAKDDIVTVKIKLAANYFVTGVQLPVIYDKTQFEIVGASSNSSYLTFNPDSVFANGTYDRNGSTTKVDGFKYTSNPDKWNTDAMKEQYAYAWITASPKLSVTNFKLVMPKDDIFVSFHVKALADVEDATQSIFISPDWAKTTTVKKGSLTVGFAGNDAEKDALSYVSTGMTYTVETISHTEGEAVVENIVAPDCVNTGSYDTVVYCTVCGDEVSRETTVVDALGHTEGEAVEENRNEATCTEDGSYDIVIYCTVCGEETLREFHIIDAKGHDDVTLQEWSNDNETHYKECSCGERVDSTNHTFKWVIDKNSTCTSTGLKHEECDICGFIRNDNTVVEKTPHTTIKFDRVEPTCQEEGNIEYYFCSSCAKYYSDSECTNMIKVSQVGLEKIDHVYGDWVVETEPSCDKQGFRYKQCISCDEMITETIEKTDHSYTENVIVPTCTKSGYTQLTCDVCGDSDIKDFVEPLGHKYTSVVTPPTATEDGYTTYTCERCDDNYKDDFISPGTGLTVTGTVVSFGSEFDYITINLISADTGEILYTTSVLGNSAVYAFNAVLPGDYIIDASKNNHSDRTYKITVKNEDVTQDAKIHLIGDINGDGKVNTIDVARANANAKGVTSLTGYELACVDINGDGRVNTIDVARINAHAKGVTTPW